MKILISSTHLGRCRKRIPQPFAIQTIQTIDEAQLTAHKIHLSFFKQFSRLPNRFSNEQQPTWHDLKPIEALALKLGYCFIGLALLLGAPILNVVQYIDSGGVLGFDGEVLFIAEDGLIHGREIDDGDR